MSIELPHHEPHQGDELAALKRGLSAAVDAGIGRSNPPPGRPEGRPAPGNVGPLHSAQSQSMGELYGQTPRHHIFSNQDRVTSPLEMLLEVVDDTYRLQQQVDALVTAVTGEQATPLRLRDVGAPQCGLLPSVARLSSEISGIHAAITRRIEQAMRAIT